MKRIILILLATVMLAGCATYSAFATGGTAAEKQAAMCADANQGLALAQIGLSAAATPAQKQYWNRYLKGVSQAVDLYCTGK